MTHRVVFKSKLDLGEVVVRFSGSYEDCVLFASIHHNSDIMCAETGRLVSWSKGSVTRCVICHQRKGDQEVMLDSGHTSLVCSPCKDWTLGD